MTKYPDLFAALAAPFDQNQVKLRAAQGGRQLHYITARTAMNRLDDVLGPENWWDTYKASENSVECHLTIRLPDGDTLTKVDAGGYAGMADSGDDDKSGYSDGFKRSAAKFGVGRYLYGDGVPSFVRDREPALAAAAAAHRDPEPAPARGGNGDNGHRAGPPRSAGTSTGNGGGGNGTSNRGNGSGGVHNGPPRTGRALFAWSKDREEEHGPGLIDYLNDWGRAKGFPGRMIEWDDRQVAAAHGEAVRAIADRGGRGADVYDEALAN